MRQTQPTLNTIVENFESSITLLLEALQPMSAMILVYSAIDILGALDSDDGIATRDTFVSWTNRYMAPTAHGYSGLDLYSARCGLLHTWSPRTKLTKSGTTREVIYIIDRPISLVTQLASGPIVIHPPWLWLSFREGASRFVAEAKTEKARWLCVSRNLGNLYFERTQ